MSVPKSKILSVSRGILGLNEMKIGSGKTTQKFILNINSAKAKKLGFFKIFIIKP